MLLFFVRSLEMSIWEQKIVKGANLHMPRLSAVQRVRGSCFYFFALLLRHRFKANKLEDEQHCRQTIWKIFEGKKSDRHLEDF